MLLAVCVVLPVALGQDTCGAQTGGSTDPVACDPDFWLKRPTYATIECDVENAGAAACVKKCCMYNCANPLVTCPEKLQKKKNAELVACDADNVCVADACCDPIPQTALDRRLTVRHGDSWCVEDADCRQHGDAEATCSAANVCQCSAFYTLGNPSGVQQCFRTVSPDVTFTVRFKEGVDGRACDPELAATLPTSVQDGIVRLFANHTQGTVVNAAIFCVEVLNVKHVEAVVTVSVPTEFPAGRDVDAAARERLTKLLKANLFITRELGHGLESYAAAAACPATPAHVSLAFAAPSGVCFTLRCDDFYEKPAGTKGGACVARTLEATSRPFCLVDGDCRYSETLARCVGHACVAAPKLVPRKLKTPAVFARHHCRNDENCRGSGDANATCALEAGLGNWCNCTEGFAYVAPYVATTCVKSGALPETVSLAFNVVTNAALPCRPSAPVIEAVKVLLGAKLGELLAVTTECYHHKAYFRGYVKVPRTFAQELSETTDVNAVVTMLNTELNLLDHRTTTYKELAGVSITEGTVGAPYQCNVENAVVSAPSFAGSCNAVVCGAGYAREYQEGVALCVLLPPVDTTVPAPVFSGTGEEKNDETLLKRTLGISIAIGVVVLVLGLLWSRFAPGADAQEEQRLGDDSDEEMKDEE